MYSRKSCHPWQWVSESLVISDSVFQKVMAVNGMLLQDWWGICHSLYPVVLQKCSWESSCIHLMKFQLHRHSGHCCILQTQVMHQFTVTCLSPNITCSMYIFFAAKPVVMTLPPCAKSLVVIHISESSTNQSHSFKSCTLFCHRLWTHHAVSINFHKLAVSFRDWRLLRI